MKQNACSLRVHVNAVSMGVGGGVLKIPFVVRYGYLMELQNFLYETTCSKFIYRSSHVCMDIQSVYSMHAHTVFF